MSYELDKQIVVLTTKTVNVLLKENSDALALYVFYIITAKKQKTNSTFATISYVAKGMGWGDKKVRQNKNILKKYNLIEDIKRVNKQTGKVEGWYVQVNYIWKEKNHPSNLPQCGLSTMVEKDTQMLKVNKLSALSKEREVLAKHKSISYLENIPKEDLKDFVTKYACYPKDVIDKANSLIDYCKSKGKKYKDYKAFLNNALRIDYGLRPVTNPGEGDFIW